MWIWAMICCISTSVVFCFFLVVIMCSCFVWWLIDSTTICDAINCSFLLNGQTSLSQAFRSVTESLLVLFGFCYYCSSQDFFLDFSTQIYFLFVPWPDHSCYSSWTWSSPTWFLQDCELINMYHFFSSKKSFLLILSLLIWHGNFKSYIR